MKYKIVTLLLVIGSIVALNRKTVSPSVSGLKKQVQQAVAEVKEAVKTPAQASLEEKKLLLEAQNLNAELSDLRQKRQSLYKKVEFIKEEDFDSNAEAILQEIATLDQQKHEIISRLVEKYSTITKNI